MGTAVFDICDTLYATNTTVGFLRFLGKRGHHVVSSPVDRWTDPKRPQYWLGAAAYRLMGRDMVRDRIIGSLAGLERSVVEAAAVDYVATDLANLENHVLFERLRAHQSAGDTILLASSSLDPVVSAIGRSLGVDTVASELTFADNICVGTLSTDLTGRKAGAVAAKLGHHVFPLMVYTDNRSDADLIAMADRAVIVVPKGRPMHRWAGNDHEYLAV